MKLKEGLLKNFIAKELNLEKNDTWNTNTRQSF